MRTDLGLKYIPVMTLATLGPKANSPSPLMLAQTKICIPFGFLEEPSVLPPPLGTALRVDGEFVFLSREYFKYYSASIFKNY